jgi:hypothetical protein
MVLAWQYEWPNSRTVGLMGFLCRYNDILNMMTGLTHDHKPGQL